MNGDSFYGVSSTIAEVRISGGGWCHEEQNPRSPNVNLTNDARPPMWRARRREPEVLFWEVTLMARLFA
jgi:hypothetical protein